MNRTEQAGVREGAVEGGRAWRSEAQGGEAHASGLLSVAEDDCAVRLQVLRCVVANRTPTKANKTAGEGDIIKDSPTQDFWLSEGQRY